MGVWYRSHSGRSRFVPPRDLLQVSSERQHSSSTILFTAFEPSGDSHAAPIIRALRERFDGVEVCAWGGPKMEKAGATMIEHSAIECLFVTDSIETQPVEFCQKIEVVSVAPLFGEAIRRIHQRESISVLFPD